MQETLYTLLGGIPNFGVFELTAFIKLIREVKDVCFKFQSAFLTTRPAATYLYHHAVHPLHRKQGSCMCRSLSYLPSPLPCPPSVRRGLAPAGTMLLCTRRHLSHKKTTLQWKPGKIGSEGTPNGAAVLLGSAPTSEHQMWFWSREDVEPTERSGWGAVRPSVLQRCGDAVMPAEEQRQWPSWSGWPWQRKGQPKPVRHRRFEGP